MARDELLTVTKPYYLTTPLYYVNAKPHVGHSYTNIAADCLARFMRLSGREVFFLTGTDEHGQKVQKASDEAGVAPEEFTDTLAGLFKELWKNLDISYDDFIRTTEPRHVQTVRSVWKILNDKKDIYKSHYSGWYCTPCETFWTERQVVSNPLCPECKRRVEKIEEENYFFKLSKYQSWLLNFIESQPGFILPLSRRNEVLSFLKNNELQDLCVSRPKNRLSWGIEVPFDANHVTYVWFDALINYVSAIGYPDEENRWKTLWPADVHIVGKDILRHHAIIWPILLKALELTPPRMIFAHGWWIQGGEKMSKSLGNVMEPLALVREFGVDAYRYFLLREISFGQDGVLSEEALLSRYNHDLANDLGNLLNRALVMVEKYFNGCVTMASVQNIHSPCRSSAEKLPSALLPHFEELNFSQGLADIWGVVTLLNGYVEEKAPWKLAKEKKEKELREALLNLIESLKFIAQALYPFMPRVAAEMWTQLGYEGEVSKTAFTQDSWGRTAHKGRIQKGAPLFPRKEV